LLYYSTADIDPANIQAVSIRVLAHFEHKANDNMGKVWRNRFILFNFKASHGEKMGEFVSRTAWVNEAAKPGFREFHEPDLSKIRHKKYVVQITTSDKLAQETQVAVKK
jgi:hypothetical protein